LTSRGKTTFVRLYRQYLDKKDVNLIHVCYDQLVPLDVQETLSKQPGLWKEIRGKILDAVDWRVHELLNKQCDLQSNEYCSQLASQNGQAVKGRTLIVIDDNNHLSSMRYSFYQIARKHSIGFAEVYFQADLSTALQLNSQRKEGRIPASVIEKMYAAINPPDPLNNAWEKFSFAFSVQPGTQVNLDVVDRVIETAFRYPESPIEDTTEQKDNDRMVCSASVVHQADNQLRSLVNRRMTEHRSQQATKENMKQLSTTLYKVKQEVLEDLKTGFTKLDRDLVKNVQDRHPDSNSKLAAEMSQLFDQKLVLLSNAEQTS